MSSEGGPDPDQFRLDIQGLRGIAVLLVVAYHADLWVPFKRHADMRH